MTSDDNGRLSDHGGVVTGHDSMPWFDLHPVEDRLAPGTADPNDLGCWVMPDRWGHNLEVGARVPVAWIGSALTTRGTVVGHHAETGAAIVIPDEIPAGVEL